MRVGVRGDGDAVAAVVVDEHPPGRQPGPRAPRRSKAVVHERQIGPRRQQTRNDGLVLDGVEEHVE